MNIKRHRNLIAVLPALVLAPSIAAADSGFYLGVGAGGATIEAELGDSGIPGIPSSLDEDDTATKIFGGYTFDLPFFDIAIEAGYVDFGEPDVDILGEQLKFDTTGVNAWGIATFNAGLIDLYGKLGLIAWEADAVFAGERFSDDGTDVGYGVGAAFGLGPLEVRGEYEVYDLDDADVSMLSVGVLYRF